MSASFQSLPPASAPESLALFIREQAEWRREQVRRFPDDVRNVRSAAALDELAAGVAQLPRTDRLFDHLDRLGAFGPDGSFRAGTAAKKALARYRFEDENKDDHPHAAFVELVSAVAQDNAVRRTGDVLEVDGPRGKVVVNLAAARTAAALDNSAVDWVSPAAIEASEAHARADQEHLLGDVLHLYDELTGLFMPATREKHAINDDRTAALIALESGLFGHFRSARTAVRDGRVQDLVMLGRTVEEIRKKSEIVLVDDKFATRVAMNQKVPMSTVETLYRDLLVNQGRVRTREHDERDRDATEKSSWMIHARHAGLQFMVVRADGGSVITREPRAATLEDRGRALALSLLSQVGDIVLRIVPVLLERLGIESGEWFRREQLYAERLGDLAFPYVLKSAIRRHEPRSEVVVDARGFLVEKGQPVAMNEALRRAGLDPETGPIEALAVAQDDVKREPLAFLVAEADAELQAYWHGGRDKAAITPIIDLLRRALELDDTRPFGLYAPLRDAERSVDLLRRGARQPIEQYGRAHAILDGLARELLGADQPNWWSGVPKETLVHLATHPEGELGREAHDELLRRGLMPDGTGGWVDDLPETSIPGRTAGRTPTLRVPSAESAGRESRAFGRGPNKAMPILDMRTGLDYRSKYQAGKALATEAGGDPNHPQVWFDRVLPVLGKDRFRTRNADGEWVPLDDPSVA